MKIIKSLQNQNIKDIAKLKEKKYRDMTSLFLVEGEHLVKMAKEANSLETVLVDENELEKYLELVDEDNTIIVNEAIVNKLSYTKSPQGIVGVVRKKELYMQGLNKVLVLDNLQDPGNVGTLLRSALAFNYNQVFISDESVDIYNDKVIRGNEGNGISELSKNNADEIVKINMSSRIDSLNVSVAGSIAMYYIKGEK